MDYENCPICASGMGPEVNRLKNEDGIGYRKIVKQTNFSERVVRSHLNMCQSKLPQDEESFKPATLLTQEGDSGVLTVTNTGDLVTDYDDLLRMFKLSPDVFEVVEPVRMSQWDSGDNRRYSYRANFRKKVFADDGPSPFDVEGWRQRLLSEARTPSSSSRGSLVRAIVPGDQQIGKKGTQESLDNWEKSILAFTEDLCFRLSVGERFSKVWLGNGGDIVEGVANNYRNQAYASEMNLSTQIEVAYDLSVWALKYITDETGLPIDTDWVISNHGESWVREGGKDPITSRGDNIDTHIGRLVKSTFDKIPGYDGISFVIAEGNVANVLDVGGVKVYHTHNYIEKGAGGSVEAKTISAMQKQILGDPMNLGDVSIWMTHHYHHFWSKQEGEYTVFGAPALEAEKSSEWLKDMNGVWSKPGALALTVDASHPMKWHSLSVF